MTTTKCTHDFLSTNLDYDFVTAQECTNVHDTYIQTAVGDLNVLRINWISQM